MAFTKDLSSIADALSLAMVKPDKHNRMRPNGMVYPGPDIARGLCSDRDAVREGGAMHGSHCSHETANDRACFSLDLLEKEGLRL
ncbi:hypothetical protein XH96_33315 [Bradyrhizobium sp. CCBAU 51765]|nr:hypothetical protein XH96_33315 [Bradyrhizobium sp. CCBAU 51765]